VSYGNLTLKDSSSEQTGEIKAGIGTAGNTINICAGTFTLESGSIYSKNNAILIDEKAATVTINGGKITAEPNTNNSAAFYISSTSDTTLNITGGEMVGYNGILLWDNTTINITGGSIEAKGSLGIQGNGSKDNTVINISGDASVTGYYAAIYHPQGGELNISGNAKLRGWSGVVVKGGNVTISENAAITATGTANAYRPESSGFVDTGDALYVEHYDNSTNSENYGTPTVLVTGGTFTSANAKAVVSYANSNNNVEALSGFLKGGTYSTEVPEAYCAEGYIAVDNGDGTYVVKKGEYVARNTTTGVGYETLKEAFDAAQTGDTITLLTDSVIDTETMTIADGVSITLDMKGQKITVTDNMETVNYELFYIYGELTVTGNGTIELTSTHDRNWDAMSAIFHNRGGVLNIENGTFTNIGGTDMAWVVDNSGNHYGNATTNITGGTLTSSYTAIRNRMEQNSHGASGTAILNVSGGTISGTTSAIWAQAASTSTTSPALGEINISGGDISVINTARSAGAVCETRITGGTLDAVKCEVDELWVTGGTVDTFDIRSAADVSVEYAVTTEGQYVAAAACIGETNFATLAEAVNAAQEGDTVTLLANIELTETLTVPADKSITLELNGKTVSMVYTDTVTANHAMILNKGNLTIQDTAGNGKLSYKYTGANLGTNYAANTLTSEPGSVLTIKSGTIENLTYDSATIAYAIDGRTNGSAGDVTVNIEGGTITSQRQAVRIFANSTTNTGALNISGGEITGRVIVQNANAKANKAALKIEGGIFKANVYKTEVLYVGGTNGATIDMEAVVSNGTFNGEIASTLPAGFITGGTFIEDVTEYCAEDYWAVDPENDGLWTVEEDPRFSIAFANMTLGNSLDMNFAFEAGHLEDWTGMYVEIVKEYADGSTQTQTARYDDGDWKGISINKISHYYVTFHGMVAKEMADSIAVTVYNANDEAVSKVWNDSVRDYAMRTLAKPTTVEEKTMVVDMLNYGAAAQTYLGYNAGDLANNQLTDEQKALATVTTSYEDTRVKGANYIASNLNLVSNIELMMAFKNVTPDMRAVITYTNHYNKEQTYEIPGSAFELNNGTYVVYIDTLVVADGRQDVTCRIYDGDTVVAEGTDSIESYVARGIGANKNDPLGEMIMKFSDSAYAYFH